jgi:predicted ABC-type ATPase
VVWYAIHMGKRRERKIIIIAGPNGAGKTTFAQEFLPREAGCPDFINADLIARGLSPFAPEKVAVQAGNIMLNEIARKVNRRQSFAFETTLAGLNYARHIPKWRKAGYHVKLVFLSLPSADIAMARIRMRVAQGGHDVKEDIVRRRFEAGLRNFEHVYQRLADDWVLYDNLGRKPRLVKEGRNR